MGRQKKPQVLHCVNLQLHKSLSKGVHTSAYWWEGKHKTTPHQRHWKHISKNNQRKNNWTETKLFQKIATTDAARPFRGTPFAAVS